jgi:cell division cycle 20-like protein 1 (cofactor of APC complex)
MRRIPKVPFKILEAPQIQDDFYLNLVDWSRLNTIAVGLGSSVYLWGASSGLVSHLCDLSGSGDHITSVNWIQSGTHLAVGTNKGTVQIWDVAKSVKTREMSGHKSRVGSISWNNHVLSSGSRDSYILHRDVRIPQPFTNKLIGHKQEVCGLKWSPDGQQLASGGNDNKLLVWDPRTHSSNTTLFGTRETGNKNVYPLLRFTDHTAAVKAIAWSPHQRGLLASGGGTADRCIRFWNTTATSTTSPNNLALSFVDTGSQVCNLAWSSSSHELVSTHGYSQNEVVIWSHPTMTPIATLTGHSTRVLYLAVSPDGQTIVTAAGDETLRFWNVFPSHKELNKTGKIQSPLTHRNDIR